jgi:hypothetical protein
MNCHHGGCLCGVDPGAEFCSEYCRDHAAESAHGAHTCQCGHASCNLAP